MKRQKQHRQPDKKISWLRYISLGSQLMVALALAVWTGISADRWLGIVVPLLVWVLPLLVIAVTILKLVKETARDRNGK
jgi:hypothetical protein